ncbi:enoyl-CoA hydratase-related protein [Nocardia wallacei]|uniref:enoyl-CoA hydratase-related protein n=1 Tax=Nocardia wallacei TaxID=480035 RepID=UPI002453BDE0|nr:enoyl-CoA hydratase-related protein [Nocardia wallacei]
MTDQHLVTRTGHRPVTVLTLNRPDALNALDTDLSEQPTTAAETADSDPEVQAVMLTCAGGPFCVGTETTELDAITVEQTLAQHGYGRRLSDALGSCRTPLTAAVHGPALRGGCEVALACDIVVAGRSATFGLPEVTLGVIPGADGTQRLVRTVGHTTAMRSLQKVTGRPSADADTSGLISDLVDDTDCLPTAIGVRRAHRRPRAPAGADRQRRRPRRPRTSLTPWAGPRASHLLPAPGHRRSPRRRDRVPSNRPPAVTGR